MLLGVLSIAPVALRNVLHRIGEVIGDAGSFCGFGHPAEPFDCPYIDVDEPIQFFCDDFSEAVLDVPQLLAVLLDASLQPEAYGLKIIHAGWMG
jgi:hypothetical protein